MPALEATINAISTALTNLRAGYPVQTLEVPGMPPKTVTGADIQSLRQELLALERQRHNRIDRGL